MRAYSGEVCNEDALPLASVLAPRANQGLRRYDRQYKSNSSLHSGPPGLGSYLSMYTGAEMSLSCLKAISRLAVMGVLLAIAAAGCGDAGPNAPDDLPVAASTPAGSVKPVNTASSGDDLPVATSTPAGAVKPVNTASSGDDLPVATSTPAGSVKPVNTALTGDGTWVLHMVDGRPVIEGSVVTMRISASDLEGFDGCNKYFGGWYEDETPVAGP